MMIESVLTAVALKSGGQLLRAAVEGSELGRDDAAEVATALLEAIVAGQRRADAGLKDIEARLDSLATDPHEASMAAGRRLLEDAAPEHRRPEHREEMLSNARHAFADAIGQAHGRPLEVARAEAMYGLTWLAGGSPRDLSLALVRALSILQREVLVSFQFACRDNRDNERRRTATSTRVREAILGSDSRLMDLRASDRFTEVQAEYEAVRLLQVSTGEESISWPAIPRPHETIYSHPAPGLPVRVRVDSPVWLLGAEFELGKRGLRVANRSESIVVAATVEPVLDVERVISPDVSALNRHATVITPGTSTKLSHSGRGQPAAAIGLGGTEGVDLTVLLHVHFDWAAALDCGYPPRRHPTG